MSTMQAVGSIVTDGLVLHLDAANYKSYPGSGTTWTDLTINNNSGSLINGPTFSFPNGGSIVFNGTNNYVDCGNNSSLQITKGTISAWIKTTSPGSSYRSIIAKQNNYSLFVNDSILVTYDWGNNLTRTTGVNIADGNWKNVSMTFTESTGTPSNNAIIYLNGSPILTTTIKYVNDTIEVQLSGGGTSNALPGGSRPIQTLSGSIALAQIYNRALSATEVLQNYNAVKRRFGIL